MTYDFDSIIDRRGTDAAKWNVGPDELPMWVADTDFPTAPAIWEAVKARAAHGIWGYSVLPDAWYDAYVGWWRDRHGLTMEKDWLLFALGVVPAISSVIRALTDPGNKVVIQSPVYNCFFSAVTDNGRVVWDSPLAYDGHAYSIDFADLEAKLADPKAKVMLLCNPHNPTGNIWSREDLSRIGALCAQHGVTVVADEIHCDVTAPGAGYVPFASVSDTCRDISISCIAPTKAFNLAGLKTAAVAVAESALRERIKAALHADGVAAFTKCGDWLDACNAYIDENRRTVEAFLKKELPQVKAVPSKSTYLVWLDCTALKGDKEKLAEFIRERTGLFMNAGRMYGAADFLRLNVGCPRAYVQDGLKRLKAGVLAWEGEH